MEELEMEEGTEEDIDEDVDGIEDTVPGNDERNSEGLVEYIDSEEDFDDAAAVASAATDDDNFDGTVEDCSPASFSATNKKLYNFPHSRHNILFYFGKLFELK